MQVTAFFLLYSIIWALITFSFQYFVMLRIYTFLELINRIGNHLVYTKENNIYI